MSKGKTPRLRADQLVVAQGLAETRTKAQSLIMARLVLQGETIIEKAGDLLPADTKLTLKQALHPWVSRGGMKLEHAITQFHLNPKGVVALDIGASTGGFTDVLLHYGAQHVYAIDVGYGQLDYKLRNHPHVTNWEKTNARYIKADDIPEPFSWIVVDASFISLTKLLDTLLRSITTPPLTLIALIKPQFEAPRDKIKNGVVRDAITQEECCQKIIHFIETNTPLKVQDLTPSPILGPKGNKEFLVWAEWPV